MKGSFQVSGIMLLLSMALGSSAAESTLLANGGFEFSGRVCKARLDAEAKRGMTFDDADPLLPLRWTWIPSGKVAMRLVPDAHSGSRALKVTCPQGALELNFGVVEVVPGATYAFGAWTRGKGNGAVKVYGHAFEGRKELGSTNLAPGSAWVESRQTVKIPGNIRTVTLNVILQGSDEVLIDDVFLAAELARPHDAEQVMREKYKPDGHTRMFVDFDGQGECTLEGQAAIVDGGRFGKGLRLDRPAASTAVIPMKTGPMPEEGTLEYWFAPDDSPEHIYHFTELLGGDQDTMRIVADTSGVLGLYWRKTAGQWDPQNRVAIAAADSRDWFRPGQWHHVAAQWDQQAVRFYLDGLLVGISTERPGPFFKSPTALKLGAVFTGYCWSGVIDEIRLSDVHRYGPLVPANANWTPLVAAAPVSITAAKPVAARKQPVPDFTRERRTNLTPIPAAPAQAVSFSASQMKPLLHGDPLFSTTRDYPSPGLSVAQMGRAGQWQIHDPDTDGGYWSLGNVKPGTYFVGVWYESGKPGAEARQHYHGALNLYLNGKIVQLATVSDPVQPVPDVYFAEAQSKYAVALNPGDEIEVLPTMIPSLKVVRLTLYPTEPQRGRGWIHENFGSDWFTRDTALRLSVDSAFVPAPGKGLRNLRFRQILGAGGPDDLMKAADGTQAVAQCIIGNPLSVPVTVEYEAQIKEYFRETVGQDRATLTLQPHESVRREVPFALVPDCRHYTMEASVKAVNPPPLAGPSFDTINYFPGVRQSLPWTDPFTARDERALHFDGALPGERNAVVLNFADGKWASAFTSSLAPPVPLPADLKWAPCWGSHFPVDKVTPPPHGMYLRRTISMAEPMAGKSFLLTIGWVQNEGTAYVNGVKVGAVRGSNHPLVCDITKVLKPGDNDILIVLRDELAITNPDYVNADAPVLSPHYLDAPGGATGFNSIGDVSLGSRPSVACQDLLVLPSVRKQSLSLSLQVDNRDRTAVKVKVSARVLDAGRLVFEMGAQDVAVDPAQSVPLTFGKPWSDAVLWRPGNPKLYTMAVEVCDAGSGKRLDLLRVRFGFRESWLENGRIVFNGLPVRLKGSNTHGGNGVLNADDVQWIRGSCREGDDYFSFMDEFGYLMNCMISGLVNTSSRHNVTRDVFWEHAQRGALANVARLGNHPSVIAWCLSNEWLSFLDFGGGDPMVGANRFKTLADAVRAVDPSRWAHFSGDGDLNGLWNNIDTHYSLEGLHPHPISGFGFNGHSVYFPDGAFFRPLDGQFQVGKNVRLSSHHKLDYPYGEKVFMNTENLWKTGAYQPPGLCKFVGDEDVLSPAIDSGRGPVAWMWKQNIDGHRDAGASSVFNYTPVFGVARRGHSLQCFIMPDHTHHFFGKAEIKRSYSLHNDLLIPADFVFRYQLLDAAGKTVRQGKDRRKMATGDLQRGSFSFALPPVATRTSYVLKLELSAGGAFVYGEERYLDVWPDEKVPAGKPTRSIVLFDPKGTTAGVMTKAGVPFSLTDLSSPLTAEPDKTLLILGEKALDGQSLRQVGGLIPFIEAGGRMLVLAQDYVMPGLPVKTVLELKEWSSMPFVRTPQHPIFSGVGGPAESNPDIPSAPSTINHSPLTISSWDLHFWSPDHLSSKGAYSKPAGGAFITLVDSGTDIGMEWVQMMECYHGKGAYLLCQLPVAGKYEREPMARELLSRLIGYAAGPATYRAPVEQLQIVGSPDSRVSAKLQDMNVNSTFVEADKISGKSRIWLVEMAALPDDFKAPPVWKTALAEGGTAILHGVTPKQAGLASELAGRNVRIVAQPYGMWEGRGYRNGFTDLTAGLSHLDLYWKNVDGYEGASAQAEEQKYKIEDVIYWSAGAEGAMEHIYPGGLVEIPVGKGRLILDQVRWETDNGKLAQQSSRIVSAMMTGLNLAIAPYRPQRDLPKDATCKPLDLRAFANRGFKDDVSGDGKGGWSDQGSKIDLKEFPTGLQTFGGVPFLVGAEPNCCIVLKCTARPFPELMPGEAVIPVGFPVEGFWFLHSVAYCGAEETGRYEIQYEDGTTFDIKLIRENNIRDWVSSPAQFTREKGTLSKVAWTGTTEVFPVVSVFQMLWVNPTPEKKVKAVRFANPGGDGCPILISLTAVVQGGAQPATAAARNPALARELLGKGQAALDQARNAEARELLKQALQADPSLEMAHQLLCDTCEKLKDEAGVLAACRAWAAAGAKTYLPFNKIGSILERRKDYRGALEAYTKSLEIEWNQPPTIEAKSRMQKLVLNGQ